MTTLGLFFLACYIIGFVLKGRVGVLAVAASAIPFVDSAALVVGAASISPFHLGMLIYLPLVYLSIGFPRAGSSLPWVLATYSVVVTLIGPAVFAGTPVVASGIGIDEQVGRLASLDYSSSNLAQIIYLALNLAFLMALSCSSDAKRWIPPIPAVIGTLVAISAWLARQFGFAWPQDIFRNNSLNAYAYVDSPRLAAQFSEPSHLAVFALTSAVLLVGVVVAFRPRPAVAVALLALAAADILLILETGSATALGGAALFGLLAALWAGYRMVILRIRVSIALYLFYLVAMIVLVATLPDIIAYVREVIDYKLARGTSIRSRSAADLSAFETFLDSGTLGVGLGSSRSSSLLLLLLSNIGLIGTSIFLLLMGRAIRDGLRCRSKRAWAAGLVVLLAASFVSMADLVSPMMWLLAGFCWNAQQPKSPEKRSSTYMLSPQRIVRDA